MNYRIINTMCYRGVESQGDGYQVFTKTKDFPVQYENIFKEETRYESPNNTINDFADYPKAYSFRIHNNKYVYSFSTYLGRDFITNRRGNYISDLIILQMKEHIPFYELDFAKIYFNNEEAISLYEQRQRPDYINQDTLDDLISSRNREIAFNHCQKYIKNFKFDYFYHSVIALCKAFSTETKTSFKMEKTEDLMYMYTIISKLFPNTYKSVTTYQDALSYDFDIKGYYNINNSKIEVLFNYDMISNTFEDDLKFIIAYFFDCINKGFDCYEKFTNYLVDNNLSLIDNRNEVINYIISNNYILQDLNDYRIIRNVRADVLSCIEISDSLITKNNIDLLFNTLCKYDDKELVFNKIILILKRKNEIDLVKCLSLDKNTYYNYLFVKDYLKDDKEKYLELFKEYYLNTNCNFLENSYMINLIREDNNILNILNVDDKTKFKIYQILGLPISTLKIKNYHLLLDICNDITEFNIAKEVISNYISYSRDYSEEELSQIYQYLKKKVNLKLVDEIVVGIINLYVENSYFNINLFNIIKEYTNNTGKYDFGNILENIIDNFNCNDVKTYFNDLYILCENSKYDFLTFEYLINILLNANLSIEDYITVDTIYKLLCNNSISIESYDSLYKKGKISNKFNFDLMLLLNSYNVRIYEEFLSIDNIYKISLSKNDIINKLKDYRLFENNPDLKLINVLLTQVDYLLIPYEYLNSLLKLKLDTKIMNNLIITSKFYEIVKKPLFKKMKNIDSVINMIVKRLENQLNFYSWEFNIQNNELIEAYNSTSYNEILEAFDKIKSNKKIVYDDSSKIMNAITNNNNYKFIIQKNFLIKSKMNTKLIIMLLDKLTQFNNIETIECCYKHLFSLISYVYYEKELYNKNKSNFIKLYKKLIKIVISKKNLFEKENIFLFDILLQLNYFINNKYNGIHVNSDNLCYFITMIFKGVSK